MTFTDPPNQKRLFVFVKMCGCFATTIGVMVLIGWYAHWAAFVQLLPGLVPMKYNTALTFALSGAGLVLLTTRYASMAVWIGGLVFFLGFSTLLEFLIGRDLGIDQLFFKYYVILASETSARMAPLTATCFTMLGAAIALSGWHQQFKARLTAVGILTCVVSMVGLVALLGFILGIDAAYGWGSYWHMALHTAMTFFVLGVGLLGWAWQIARSINFSFLRWLPITGSFTLMTMIAFISTASFSQSRDSAGWRNHTYEVLSIAQPFLGAILDIQRGIRGYVLTGQSSALLTYQAGLDGSSGSLAKLKTLTSDNPGQQERLKTLTSDLDEVIAYSRELIEARKANGIQAAIQIEATGKGFAVIDRILTDLHGFTDEEHRLLILRSAKAQADSRDTERLLIYGITASAFLLIVSGLMASHAIGQQQELTHKAQAAERAKSEFLAIMSHEIRTPMNGVIGMTSILADMDLTEAQRDCVSTISTSGESLLTVINDILDFSKIESGRMQLESRSFNLRQCVEEALDLFAAQIRIKRLEALYLIDPDVPPHLIGDAMRLRQILVNLIGNAVKFTSQGEIAIHVRITAKEENICQLRFAVTDTGIGIAQEGIEKLFNAFQQVDTSTTRRFGGTGLGLVISKRLAEMMHGMMWVESKLGTGSTFYFSAAMKVSAEPVLELELPEAGMLASHSALIVDENATNRHILEIQLKMWGMTPTSTSGGAEALTKIANQNFDVILIDFQMPDMDGVCLARELRKQIQTPLVLLSSSGEIITGEDANLFQIQIPKPIRHSSLFNALLRIAGVDATPSPKVIEKRFDATLAKRQPLRILLAEDNSVNQKVGLVMLSRFGYTAVLASNGQRALESIDQNAFDLILMDIQMPDMDGIEAARLIREKLGDKCPAIVALTAEALEGDRQRFLDLGFDMYLSKPLQAQALKEILQSIKPLG